MDSKKILKLVFLNTGIALLNILMFFLIPGLRDFQKIGEHVLSSAIGGTVIFMSIVGFFYGNYKLLTQKEKVLKANELVSKEDYIAALRQNYGKKAFDENITLVLEQIERFDKKEETIKDILLQRFDRNEMSFKKFDVAIAEIEKLFYFNIKSMINKLNAFDEVDFERLKRIEESMYRKNTGTRSNDIVRTRMSIYNEYIAFVRNAVADNEDIIYRLEKLLLEISRFNSLEDGEIENMSAMKEIEELTNNTKYYNNKQRL